LFDAIRDLVEQRASTLPIEVSPRWKRLRRSLSRASNRVRIAGFDLTQHAVVEWIQIVEGASGAYRSPSDKMTDWRSAKPRQILISALHIRRERW
jgi:hypothetical protein